ncbi:MAG: protein kinase [Gemmatimonadaceae bacterium]
MPADLRAQLESSFRGQYTIERELGGGNMARVFVATDHGLGRRVVIKVLSGELAEGLSVKRFSREIRLAASLQQANIVPVLSAGEAGGVPHYTMPYVEGSSLRERLALEGGPSLVETLGILRDLARALAYAHDRGVVHRDIKPENVLLSGGAAVVTDFGIAKALANARGEPAGPATGGTGTVTQSGVAVGTPAYMAPEQIAGDPQVDHRADLYSFGCVAYELIAGEPPFAGRSIQALFTAHLTEQPAPVTEKHPECPRALARLVMSCLEKDPAARPQSAHEILTALNTVATHATPVERFWHARTRRQRLAVSGLLLLVALGATAFVVSARIQSMRAESAALSVAVVPFLNLSGDPAHEYLGDGMADELATALGKVPGIRIASRSLGYRYKGRRDLDAREMGRALSANYVLQGSVRPVRDRIRVSVQLTNAADNSETWSETYDRAGADAFAVQNDVANAVVDALRRRLRLAPEAVAAAVPARGTSSAQAYDAYLRGRYLLRRRGAGTRQAAEHFERSIALDSNFAAAHAALALALELLPYFEPVDARALGVRAMRVARRALALDSSLAEAHTALAMAYQHSYRWAEAEREYRRAVAAGPADPDTHIQYGRFRWYTGRLSDALPAFERARAIDPYSAVASAWVGHLLFLSGRRSAGMIELRRALEFEPVNPPALVMMAEAFRLQGQRDSSRVYAERLWRGVPAWRPVAAAALAELGEADRALAWLRAFETGPAPEHTVINAIGVYAGLRDSTRMLAAMEEATRRGEIWPTYFSLNEPRFDFVRSSGRFAAIVRGAGLDERLFTAPGAGRSQ